MGTFKIRVLSLFIVLFTFNYTATASHLAGADITWECVGQDSFLVRVQVYRDCSGINAPSSVNVDITGCSTSIVNLPMINPNGTEVSQLCALYMDSSWCNFGFFPGFKRYEYEAIIVLPPCPLWNFSYSQNARASTNNLTGQTTMYIDAEMNSQFDNCNNSPRFTMQEVPYACFNQESAIDFGVEEADCDSLYFSMLSARIAKTNNNNYVIPYSPTNPIELDFMLDPNTGRMTFTPSQIGKYIVVLKCEEFDRATQTLKGYVTKETTIIVMICDNNVPSDTSGYITNFYTTGGQQTGLYQVELCQGEYMSFDLCIYDQDLGDSISLTTNVQSALPGATWNYTSGNPACATISWTAVQGVCPTKAFAITANDNVCPMPGIQTFAYLVNVLPTTFAGSDQTICKGDSALVEVFGGSQFSWVVISGDTMNVGVNFSCDTCSSAWASPDSTTSYVITTDVVGICANIDTVTVFVVDPEPPGPITGQIMVNEFSNQTYSVTQTAGYSYSWIVTGGTIATGQGSNSINVNWGNNGPGKVCVTKTHITSNCKKDSVCLQINVVVTGVNETGFDNGIEIYPNPTTGQFTIQGATGEIQIFDLFGRLVLRTNKAQIDMSGYPSGLYVWQVGTARGKLVLE